MVLSCSAFTLLALVMSLFPLAPWLPGRFPSRTTPEILALKEKYHSGVSLRIIKKHRRPHATQTCCGVGSWLAKAILSLISSSLPMGRFPRLLASSCPVTPLPRLPALREREKPRNSPTPALTERDLPSPAKNRSLSGSLFLRFHQMVPAQF